MASSSPSTIRIRDWDIQLFAKLGQGFFGIVCSGTHVESKEPAAIKQIPYKSKAASYRKMVQTVNEEMKIIERLEHHDNIVKILEHFVKEESIWIVMEKCDLGNLRQYMGIYPKLSEKRLLDIMIQSASAVRFMNSHDPPIAHRDIRPEKVLLKSVESKHVVKLCGFGMAKCLTSVDSQDSKFAANFKPAPLMTSKKGTPQFMAPEFFADLEGGLQYDASADTFSLGLVFLMMIYPNHEFCPLSENSHNKRHLNVGEEMIRCEKNRKPPPKLVTFEQTDSSAMKGVKRVIKNMTKLKPRDRKNIDEVEEDLQEIYLNLQERETKDEEINKLKQEKAALESEVKAHKRL